MGISWSPRGWVLGQTALGGEVRPGHSDSLGLQRTESPGSSSLECPCKSGSGQMNSRLMDCQAPGPLRWQPRFIVCPAPGIPF